MPYQVTYNLPAKRGRARSRIAYRRRASAQKDADELNSRVGDRNARVVKAKYGTYASIK